MRILGQAGCRFIGNTANTPNLFDDRSLAKRTKRLYTMRRIPTLLLVVGLVLNPVALWSDQNSGAEAITLNESICSLSVMQIVKTEGLDADNISLAQAGPSSDILCDGECPKSKRCGAMNKSCCINME